MMIERNVNVATIMDCAKEFQATMKADKVYRLTMKRINPKRTTGPQSQNNAIRGYARQLCEFTGETDLNKMIRDVAEGYALGMGYPEVTDWQGKKVPKNFDDCDIAEASILYEAFHVAAADMEYILRED